MPRLSTMKQAERLINQFFDETEKGLMQDFRSTRQPTRRRALDAEMDVIDKVKARFYHWHTSQVSSDE